MARLKQWRGGAVCAATQQASEVVDVISASCRLYSPLLTFRTWMRRVVDRRKVLKIEVRINLCRRNTGVPEHFLHGTQVAGGLQHV